MADYNFINLWIIFVNPLVFDEKILLTKRMLYGQMKRMGEPSTQWA